MRGKVARIVKDKGFGFIREEGGNQEYFFHRSSVRGMLFESLEQGTEVTFEEEESEKGPRASEVRQA